MKKKNILNRAMFRQVKSPAYGTGIASNLVSSEERQRYNYGGRVGLETGTDVGFQQSPFMKQMRSIGEPLYNYGVRPLYNLARHPVNWLGEAFGYGKTADFPHQEAIDITEEGEQFYPIITKEKKPKEEIEGWEDRNRPGGQHPLFGDPHDVVEKESDVLDIRVGDEGPWTMRGEGKTAIEKELDPGAGLKVEPKEDPIVKMLKENEERAKKRGKIAALTQGVSMASNLLTEPTFAKAIAKAGKEAPQLAKAYSDEVKSAEGLPLQWDMIKEKITLEGEQAIKKAEVGEERKAAYQTGYLNYLTASMNQLKRDPETTITSLFTDKSNQKLSISPNDQVSMLSELSSQKGKVLDIQAVDITKKENYKNVRKGTVVRDTKKTGHWYIMEEDGELGAPKSILSITTEIDQMPTAT
mgnify:CR=1 FL=1